MTKYIDKVTIFLIVIFIAIITLLQTYHYYKLDYYKKRNIQYQLNEKILYTSFLVHKKEKQLQELLIDLSRNSLTIINLDEMDSTELNKICTAWNDEVFRVSFIKNVDEQSFKQTNKHLDEKCLKRKKK